LLFQAGADQSGEEEEDYLDINLEGELIDGVKIELPEEDEEETNYPAIGFTERENQEEHIRKPFTSNY